MKAIIEIELGNAAFGDNDVSRMNEMRNVMDRLMDKLLDRLIDRLID